MGPVDAELPISICPVSSACLLRGVIATLVSIIKIPVTGGAIVSASAK